MPMVRVLRKGYNNRRVLFPGEVVDWNEKISGPPPLEGRNPWVELVEDEAARPARGKRGAAKKAEPEVDAEEESDASETVI